MIERLDTFLSLIESRLERFDQFFQFKQRQDEETIKQAELLSPPPTQGHSRRSLALLMLSIKQYSMNNLNQVHQKLRLIKKQVLLNSLTNLEYLYHTLADQYNSLFNEELADDIPSVTSRELLSHKIIDAIQFFDEKLLAIDDFIKPHHLEDYSAAVEYNHLRFFNFNKAVNDGKHHLLHYYQLPLLWRENKYIVYGYRFSLSHWRTVRLIFQMHNETINIWTHGAGVAIMMYLMLVHYPLTTVYAANSWVDNVPVYLFFFSAFQCLLGSCVWHTMANFAHYPTRANCACVDYTGITVLITFLVILSEYTLLYHHPNFFKGIAGFLAFCGVAGFAFNWSPYFDKPECRSLRIGFFVGLAFLGVIAMVVVSLYQGLLYTLKFFFPIVWKLFLWYGLGVVFYGGLMPERFRYDVIYDDDTEKCTHDYGAKDVLTDNVGHDGEEELEQLEDDLQFTETENQFELLVNKYFPAQPKRSPFANDFMLLWWVDYIGSSHNIWHVCVVLGVVGHYFGSLDMFNMIQR